MWKKGIHIRRIIWLSWSNGCQRWGLTRWSCRRITRGGKVKWDTISRAASRRSVRKHGIIDPVGGHGYQNFLNAEMEGGKLFEQHPEWFGQLMLQWEACAHQESRFLHVERQGRRLLDQEFPRLREGAGPRYRFTISGRRMGRNGVSAHECKKLGTPAGSRRAMSDRSEIQEPCERRPSLIYDSSFIAVFALALSPAGRMREIGSRAIPLSTFARSISSSIIRSTIRPRREQELRRCAGRVAEGVCRGHQHL